MVNTIAYERYILACMLNDGKAIWETTAILEPKDFSYAQNGYVFSALKALAEAEQEADIMSVYNYLTPDTKKLLDSADSQGNGLHYLEALQNSPFSIQNLQENIKVVKSNSVRKQLSDKCTELANKIARADHVYDTNELIEMALQSIVDSAFLESEHYDSGLLGDGLRELLKEKIKNPTPIIGHKTGFYRFDEMVGGLQRGKLTVVAARPKIGKSTLLLNWAKFISIDQNIPLLYLDTEMTSEEQRTRLLAMVSGVEEKKILTGLYSRNAKEVEKVEKAVELIEKAPLYHIYMPDFTLEKVIAYTRKYQVQYGIESLFLDYIKLPDNSDLRSAAEYQHLGYLTTGLKNKIAGKMDIPVVTAAQFNRKAVGAENMETDQIAGSDRILHYANMVLGLRRKTPQEVEDNGRGNLCLTIVASRNSEDDVSFDLMFNKPKLQISEVGLRKENTSDFYGCD